MPVRERDYGKVILLEMEEKEKESNELFHELIGAIRRNSNLHIGAFERRYLTYSEAHKAMDALIKYGIFHAGTIRTYYTDGTIRLLGGWITDVSNGLAPAIVADMLGYIVGDKPIGTFETNDLFRSKIAKEIANGIIPDLEEVK
jgi:hypothetical protein